ncbi:MAG: MBL fold metallo-hydrolase [Gammaproteobacteria bacterium]|nr:MBL fold metallo-hydrolase [Gammaproteobacteria bacterium]
MRRARATLLAALLAGLSARDAAAQAAVAQGPVPPDAPAVATTSAPTSDPARDPARRAAARMALYREHAFLRAAVGRVGGFGNPMSPAVANHMYSRSYAPALEDAARMLQVEPHGPGSWLLRFPWVNVAVFETTEGLVLVDSGHAPAGPALRDALRKLSPKRVHTIIYTHHHIDHMLGAWALLEAGERPQIVATAGLVDEVRRDIASRGLTSRLNNQALDEFPKSLADLPMPTRTFEGRLELKIGRDRFVLTHAPGETADQLWVAVPTRRIVVAADYFQPFLPNAGNGKRRQRFVGSWAQALRDMAALEPLQAFPMHGPAIVGTAEILRRFNGQARMMESIAGQTLAALNSGVRKYDAAQGVALPADLAASPDAAELYSTPRDIARTVAQEYTGWWNELPSEWDPSTRAAQAREVVALAGGIEPVLRRIEALRATDLRLACHLADWAWLAAPADARVLQAATDTWLERLRRESIPTQEAVEYVEHLVTLRVQREALSPP